MTLQIMFAQVLIAEKEETSEVDGYGVFRKDRILSVYANAKETASAIVQEILRTMNYEEVLLYIWNEFGNLHLLIKMDTLR